MISTLSQQIQALQRRLQQLSQDAQREMHPQDLLPRVFDELDCAFEVLEALEIEICQQQEQLLERREHLETERQSYQDLFEFAPVSYLITTPDGVIRRANRAAAAFFETAEKFLIGRSLALFVPEGERRAFRRAVAELASTEGVQEWHVQMQPWGGTACDVILSVVVVRDTRGRPLELRWMLTKNAHTGACRERAVGEASELALY